MVVTPSVDPMGGAVTYEYEWRRDGMIVATETSATLPNALTTRGQEWTVSVTPVAGARRGPAGTATITIENTPPVLVTVGLDQYHPVVGERVRAVPGSIVDADGDVAGRHYQWYRGSVALAGATGAQLDLSMFVEGDDLRLESWATDAEDGPHVSVGPVVVLADISRWRPVTAPTEHFSQGGTTSVAHDQQRERFIQFLDGEVWEFVVVGTELRAARLAPSGSPPAQSPFQIVLHDSINARLLVVDRDDAMLLHSLDLSRRGRESWTTVRATGDRPPVEGNGLFAVWTQGARIWLYGGNIEATPPEARLVSLDVSLVGAEQWDELPLGTDDPNVFLSAVVAHPSRPDHALLFGGADFTSGEPNLDVFDVSLATGAVTFVPIGELPGPRLAARAVVRTGTVVVAGGAESLSSTDPLPILDFDVEASEFAMVATMPSNLPSAVLAANSDGSLSHVGFASSASGRALEVTSIDPAAGTAMVVAHEDGSPETDGAIVIDGTLEAIEVGAVWALRVFDPLTHFWASETIGGDLVLGTAPAVRSGFRTQSTYSDLTGRGMVLFGGRAPSGTVVDTDLWELQFDARWIHRRVTTGSTPSARYDAASASVACPGGTSYVIAGGRGSGGGLLDDTWLLSCVSDRDCAWTETATTGLRPAHASSSLVATTDHDLLMARAGTPAVLTMYPCAAGGSWGPMTNTGAPPASLALQSMTYTRAILGMDTLLVLAGGDSIDEVYEVTVVDDTTLRWARVTVDVTDSPPPSGAPVVLARAAVEVRAARFAHAA